MCFATGEIKQKNAMRESHPFSPAFFHFQQFSLLHWHSSGFCAHKKNPEQVFGWVREGAFDSKASSRIIPND